MFTYQKDTKSLFVAECGKKDFWREIRKSSTTFNIDTRRAILRAVEAKDEAAMQKWAEHTDYQKFMLKTLRDLKTKAGKEKWQKKPLDKKLLAWADDLKKSLTAFQFCCYQFDEATVKTKDGKTKKGARRLLKGCHLNGLVMLDIDHVENPMEVWEKLQANEELMARVYWYISPVAAMVSALSLQQISRSGTWQIMLSCLLKKSDTKPTLAVSMLLEIRSLQRRMKFYLLTKKDYLRIMMKISTGSSLPSIVRRKRSRCIINSLLMIMLLVMIALRLLLWPTRLLWQGLGKSAR